MRGVEALEFFWDEWRSKIKEFDEYGEIEAMIEYMLGNEKRITNTKVIIEKFFDKKISFEDEIFEDLKTCFLPEDVEYDPFSGNLYISRNLYTVKIAPKIC